MSRRDHVRMVVLIVVSALVVGSVMLYDEGYSIWWVVLAAVLFVGALLVPQHRRDE